MIARRENWQRGITTTKAGEIMSKWTESTGDIVGAALRGEIDPEDFGSSPRPAVHRRFADPLLTSEQWEKLMQLASKPLPE